MFRREQEPPKNAFLLPSMRVRGRNFKLVKFPLLKLSNYLRLFEENVEFRVFKILLMPLMATPTYSHDTRFIFESTGINIVITRFINWPAVMVVRIIIARERQACDSCLFIRAPFIITPGKNEKFVLCARLRWVDSPQRLKDHALYPDGRNIYRKLMVYTKRYA